MDKYAEAPRRFYEVYRPISRKHGLRLHIRFSLHHKGFIKIYQGEGQEKKQIIKVEEEDDVFCFEKATQDLLAWAKEKEESRRKSA